MINLINDVNGKGLSLHSWDISNMQGIISKSLSQWGIQPTWEFTSGFQSTWDGLIDDFTSNSIDDFLQSDLPKRQKKILGSQALDVLWSSPYPGLFSSSSWQFIPKLGPKKLAVHHDFAKSMAIEWAQIHVNPHSHNIYQYITMPTTCWSLKSPHRPHLDPFKSTEKHGTPRVSSAGSAGSPGRSMLCAGKNASPWADAPLFDSSRKMRVNHRTSGMGLLVFFGMFRSVLQRDDLGNHGICRVLRDVE